MKNVLKKLWQFYRKLLIFHFQAMNRACMEKKDVRNYILSHLFII